MKQANNIGETLSKLAKAATDNTTYHAQFGFAGYEQYQMKSSDDGPYLLWNQANDAQLDNGKAFSWNGTFDAEAYLTYPPDTKGITFPQMQSAQKRLGTDFHLARRERYAAFVNTLNINDKPAMQVLSEQEGLFRLIQESLQRQINSMERIDDDIIGVLKVFYFECERHLKPVLEQNKEAFYQLLNDVKHLYQTGIRVYCKPDVLATGNWLPKKTGRPYVPEPIAQSTTAGILDLCRRKEKVLLQAVPLYEKIVHLETLKFYALNDMPLMLDDEQPLPGEFEPRNEAGKEMKADSKKIDELYLSDIIRIAKELIQQVGRAKCVTSKGTAKNYLYNTVHIKLESKPGRGKPAANTVKNKINKHVLAEK